MYNPDNTNIVNNLIENSLNNEDLIKKLAELKKITAEKDPDNTDLLDEIDQTLEFYQNIDTCTTNHTKNHTNHSSNFQLRLQYF